MRRRCIRRLRWEERHEEAMVLAAESERAPDKSSAV